MEHNNTPIIKANLRTDINSIITFPYKKIEIIINI